VVTAVRVVPYSIQASVRGEAISRAGWWLSVTDSDGIQGRGDAASWPGFGHDPDVIAAALHSLCVALQGRSGARIAEVLQMPWPAEVRHAAELALLDIEAQRAGSSIADTLRPDSAASVRVHTLVADPQAAIDAVARGALHLKIKLPHHEQSAIRLVRSIATVAPSAQLRLDANARYTIDAADTLLSGVRDLNVEWLEQPVGRLRDFRALRHHRVPLAADESVLSEPLSEVCAYADVAVVKPMYVGGPRRAIDLADRFGDAGLKVCFTHALESAVGRQGAWHVAAAWGVGVHGVGQQPDDAGTVALPGLEMPAVCRVGGTS
jgi:L-Ala-D/L-Glu epimerase